MLENAGRKVLFWASVYLTALLAYGLFERLYSDWLVSQSLPPGWGFWNVELGLAPIVVGQALAVVAGAVMALWNFRSRTRPATEVTYLFWVGLAIMAYVGPQLVIGVTYTVLGFNYGGGWPFEQWARPAVPFFVGIVMVLTAVGHTISHRKPSPVAVVD